MDGLERVVDSLTSRVMARMRQGIREAPTIGRPWTSMDLGWGLRTKADRSVSPFAGRPWASADWKERLGIPPMRLPWEGRWGARPNGMYGGSGFPGPHGLMFRRAKL